MKQVLASLALLCALTPAFAQQAAEAPKTGGFQKDRLFTGGSLSLGFGTGYFLGGVNPMLGYRITNWLEGGIAVNYTFTQIKSIDFNTGQRTGEKARQTIFGAGAFTRIYPVRFLFAHAQFERNFINFTYDPGSGGELYREKRQANSFLVGAGYTSGRDPEGGSPYGFLSVLWDVLKEENSPYVDAYGRMTPQVRAGLIIPLFQGPRNPAFDRGGPLKR
ncbi:hypothetical protein [Flaviaesturariibacter amylovorans]|uniref:Outer membrane protein beta-barrel domain-containing protein n=1 Tax=Flaviaesturariibacter amylovorans TaxID=1084520 RepID=A0ABP8HBC0_9BACT